MKRKAEMEVKRIETISLLEEQGLIESSLSHWKRGEEGWF